MFLPIVFFVLLVGAFYVGLQRDDDNSLPSVLIGEMAPDITKNELYNGSEVTAELMKSSGIKLVNFWASWCPPCRAEHAKLLEIAESGTVIVGVNIKDDQENANSYLKRYGNPFQAGFHFLATPAWLIEVTHIIISQKSNRLLAKACLYQ